MTFCETDRYACSRPTGLKAAAMAEDAIVVLTTCGTDEDAATMARALVEHRLAACVNAIGGVASTYRWEGKIQQDRETLLIVKTTAAQLAAVERTISELSKYDLPEVVALPLRGGSTEYLRWVTESVGELKD